MTSDQTALGLLLSEVLLHLSLTLLVPGLNGCRQGRNDVLKELLTHFGSVMQPSALIAVLCSALSTSNT